MAKPFGKSFEEVQLACKHDIIFDWLTLLDNTITENSVVSIVVHKY